MREIIRAAVIAALVFMLAQDIKEVITGLSSTSSLRPVIDWMYSAPNRDKFKRPPVAPLSSPVPPKSIRSGLIEDEDDEEDKNEVEGIDGKDSGENVVGNPLQDPALEAIRKKLRNAGYTVATGDTSELKSLAFDDKEKQQIMVLKAHLTSVMQEWCLPKLVCELHASVSERNTVTEAERSLLSLIRETSLGTMGEVISRYHFAAHMGQLLSGVEGNGCHNLYPNCPLSGNRVLQMVKKVRLR